jgi:hypothetical protein
MEQDDAPMTKPRSPATAPTDSELSRMGREAVRQPADPRLDKELARMGLTDAPDLAGSERSQARGRVVASDQEIERLRQDLRRTQRVVWVLAAATAILAVLVVISLAR